MHSDAIFVCLFFNIKNGVELERNGNTIFKTFKFRY